LAVFGTFGKGRGGSYVKDRSFSDIKKSDKGATRGHRKGEIVDEDTRQDSLGGGRETTIELGNDHLGAERVEKSETLGFRE